MVKVSPLLSSTHIYMIVFLIIAGAYAVYFGYREVYKKRNTEHFVDEEYAARIEVMKVFDLVLNKKPTPEEIKKYSEYKNEQDILLHVLKDYKKDAPKPEKINVIEEEALHLHAAHNSLTGKLARNVIEEESKHDVKIDKYKEIPLQVSVSQRVQELKELYTQDDKICMNKNYIKQMLDDWQAKIDSLRVLVS